MNPELYINRAVEVDDEIVGNQFNQVLKESLLSGSRDRIIATKREQRLNKVSFTSEKKQKNRSTQRHLGLSLESLSGSSNKLQAMGKKVPTESGSFEDVRTSFSLGHSLANP